jgi:hypothetical protein
MTRSLSDVGSARQRKSRVVLLPSSDVRGIFAITDLPDRSFWNWKTLLAVIKNTKDLKLRTPLGDGNTTVNRSADGAATFELGTEKCLIASKLDDPENLSRQSRH